MIMRKLFTVVFMVALVFGAGAVAALEREIPVRSGGLIEFDLKTGGDITIIGWSSESVQVSADLSGSSSDNVDVTVEEKDGGVLIRSRFTEDRKRQSSSVELEVRVPSVSDVKISSTGGGISIDGVEGTFSGKTMGGKLNRRCLRRRQGHIDGWRGHAPEGDANPRRLDRRPGQHRHHGWRHQRIGCAGRS
jgi:hypothetical protein